MAAAAHPDGRSRNSDRFLAITPAGAAGFAASAVNWSGSGQDLANGGTVPVSAGLDVTVWAGFTGSTQFIVDVTGYYA